MFNVAITVTHLNFVRVFSIRILQSWSYQVLKKFDVWLLMTNMTDDRSAVRQSEYSACLLCPKTILGHENITAV